MVLVGVIGSVGIDKIVTLAIIGSAHLDKIVAVSIIGSVLNNRLNNSPTEKCRVLNIGKRLGDTNSNNIIKANHKFRTANNECQLHCNYLNNGN